MEKHRSPELIPAAQTLMIRVAHDDSARGGRRERNRPFLPVLLLLTSVLLGWAQPVAAQSGQVVWSPPTNLSGSREYSAFPAVITDEFGFVHTFWSEEMGGAPFDQLDTGAPAPHGNTIYYSRWDGSSWTTPVDILFVANESVAEYLAVEIDSDSWLHVVWTGQANIYYSQAPSWRAGSAQAWSSPVAVAGDSARSMWESDVIVDSAGNIDVFYAARGAGAGVHQVRSNDDGISWESAGVLSYPFDSLETSFSHVRVAQDATGRLHVVWQTNQADGYGQAVYYTRSLDAGETWQPAVQLEYREPEDVFVSWPYLAVRNESELNLVYTNGTNRGRAFRVSMNGGQDWEPPRDIITEMEGINGYVIPLYDSAGTLHLIANMRTRAEQVVGIYYTSQTADGWAPVTHAVVGHPSSNSAHWTAAAVLRGNDLHIVWDDIATGEIWHAHGFVAGVESHATAPTPAPRDSEPTPEAAAGTALPQPAGSPNPTPFPDDHSSASPGQQPVTQDPILIGAAASLLLVLAAAIWRWLRLR